MAALLYAGPDSFMTGPAALRFHGIRRPDSQQVDVLVPAQLKRASLGYVVLHRTRRLPRSWNQAGERRYVLPARAVADTVCRLSSTAEARTVVGSAVQQRRCTIDQLAAELRACRQPGAALLRTVLAEVADGIRSAPEGDLRALIIRAGLPLPMFNPDLYLDGEFLARPDAWWPDAGVAAEVDSKEFHLLPADWEQTMRRHRRMTAAGIRVLHFSPGQLRTEPQQVLSDITAALTIRQPVPGITVRGAA
jgi:hypothetical protein